MVATSRLFLNPPPSPPSTTRPSTPASMAFCAAASDGTTWNTVRPLPFSASQYLFGSPAEVVTNFTPWSATKDTMSGSRTNAWATLIPHGLSVSDFIFATSSRTSSRRPDEVSMMPKPPALETALASCARAIQPIGACTIGYFTPSSSVMRFFMAFSLPESWTPCRRGNPPTVSSRFWRSQRPGPMNAEGESQLRGIGVHGSRSSRAAKPG